MNTFGSKSEFKVNGQNYEIFRLKSLESQGFNISRLPYSLRILLENLLRTEDGKTVTAEHIKAFANYDPKAAPSIEIAFSPARVLLQDFTGVPCVVDLAAMREAMKTLGGDPKKINPLQPVELVIDHSVQVDVYGNDAALLINRDLEFERNQERYEFLKWGQNALDNFKVVPPNTGICHQVNLEYLSRVTFVKTLPDGTKQACPDTLVGTDSHTTMVNGLGVLGWGVGGIEAEAAMLGQPVSMLIPQVVGFRLKGKLPEGSTATDLVLTVTQMLRKLGVVNKFVEFFGSGLANLSLADRATIGNMSPEFGATCAIFPVDNVTLSYLALTNRDQALTEAYFKGQGLFHQPDGQDAEYSDVLELDLHSVEPSVAGPKRPQDRLRLSDVASNFNETFASQISTPIPSAPTSTGGIALAQNVSRAETEANAAVKEVHNGAVVVAAITSCTNTSNPSVMTAAGLLAKKAVDRGLRPKPWVKTSLAPGSRVASDILVKAGLMTYLDQLNFNVVGYGCTTCIGNSGPLPEAISNAVNEKGLVVCSVLSGNRNFEGRINQDVKANYLMSPPLVVAYALAGTIDIDLHTDPLGQDHLGKDVYLRDIWPTQKEVEDANRVAVKAELYKENYKNVFQGDEKWREIDAPQNELFEWSNYSTYVRCPPYFDGMSATAPVSVLELVGMRVLAKLGDSITTDHISPAGAIKVNSAAGAYLLENGIEAKMFNSYGSRRGNHEVMMRGTFGNIRLRNQLVPGVEGAFTRNFLNGEVSSIYDAAEQYKSKGIPLLIVAGKEYGSGSSRDWAAKGPMMLGVKAVLAESLERIHRSNLIGMGIVPLEFTQDENAENLGIDGTETFDLVGLQKGISSGFKDGKLLDMVAAKSDGSQFRFKVKVRIDTPQEQQYYLHGGILQYVLRSLLSD